jgi:hypothetical protein
MLMAEQQIRFDDGAAYERMMGTWSRFAGDIFLDWLAPRPGLRWIDIGCGKRRLQLLAHENNVRAARVHHIGTFPQLEDQMTNFTSDIDRGAAEYSPDRVDTLVWAFSELLVEPMKSGSKFELYRRNAEAAEQRDKPQPTQTTRAIGSMERLAEQKRSR